jgi:hypothetical protein
VRRIHTGETTATKSRKEIWIRLREQPAGIVPVRVFRRKSLGRLTIDRKSGFPPYGTDPPRAREELKARINRAGLRDQTKPEDEGGRAIQWRIPVEGIKAVQVSYVIMRAKIAIPGLALAGLILAGCANMPSTPAAEQDRKAPPAQQDPWQSLAEGMTADQVRAALGQPINVRPMQTSGAEIWVYRRITAREVGLVSLKTEDIPYNDPFSGQQRTIQEPVYSQEERTVEEELQLLLYEGKLMSWKSRFLSARTYQ